MSRLGVVSDPRSRRVALADRQPFLGSPFGDFGESGYGWEHAIESLLEFTRTKSIREPSGLSPIPEWPALGEILGRD